MPNLQVRLEDEQIDQIDELAGDLRLSRSEAARKALHEGMRRIRLEQALGRYLNEEFSLCRAAEHAGVSIQEMAEVARARGIPFFRYSPEELRQDIERARRWRKG